MKSSRALARDAGKRGPRVSRYDAPDAVERIRAQLTAKVTEVVGGLFKEPTEKGYNPDAAKTRAECSMRTHTAIALAEQLGITRSLEDNRRPLGIIVLQGRIDNAREWEAEARTIDLAALPPVVKP